MGKQKSTTREGNSTATTCVCVMRGGGGDVNYMLMLIRACLNQSGGEMSFLHCDHCSNGGNEKKNEKRNEQTLAATSNQPNQ